MFCVNPIEVAGIKAYLLLALRAMRATSCVSGVVRVRLIGTIVVDGALVR